MSPVEIAIEVAGWTGAALILLAYVLLSTRKLTGESAAFHWINLAGAIGFIVNGWSHGAIPNAAMNVVWALVAIYSLIRLSRPRAQDPATPE
jgi:hypothetical protein